MADNEKKIHRVQIDEFIHKAEPTVHLDKKVIESNLTFRKAYMKMLEGKKISRPCFDGWWFLDRYGMLTIHDRYGEEITEGNLTITVTNTLANDWEVIK